MLITHSPLDEPCQVEALLALGLTFGGYVIAQGLNEEDTDYTVAQRELDLDFPGALAVLEIMEPGLWQLRDGVLYGAASRTMLAGLLAVLCRAAEVNADFPLF